MRNNQNKRMRGRNNRGGGKSHNPLTRVYESNGPDVKIRGTANHVAEKYIQLARDAQSSGDPVAAENYYQHAEHYFRLIAAAQEQFRQNQPSFYRPEGGGEQPQQHNPQQRAGDDSFDGDDDGTTQPHTGGEEPHYPREHQHQNYQPREGQQHQPREHQQYQPRDYQPREQQHHQQHQPRQQHDNRPQPSGDSGGDVDRLPSFITGAPQPSYGGGQNGYDNNSDRFPLHRRRRRGHRGPRHDMQSGPQDMGGNDGPEDSIPPAPAGE